METETYNWRILQSLEVDEFWLEIVLNVLLLLLWALACVLLHVWYDCICMVWTVGVVLAWVLAAAVRIWGTAERLAAVAAWIVALHELYFDSFFLPVAVLKKEVEHATKPFLFYFVVLFLFI